MNRWRIVLVVLLISTPILVWAGFGSYYLWSIGWGFWAWWPMIAMVALGYLLAWHWQRQRRLLRPPDFEVSPHWTPRDHEAMKLVEAKALEGSKQPPEKLGKATFYLQTAQELARELAAHYHPGTEDPVDNLTLPEILAVLELASHDLGEMVEQHLPGGHLLTVRDWKRTRQLQQWVQTGTNVWWAITAIFNPLQTGLRYTASQLGITAPMRMLQQNLLVWFYTAYVQRLGCYLIDLNSGRLRVGATRYRELVEQLKAEQARAVQALQKQAVGPLPPQPEATIEVVTITLLGQVKAGKSSLINALIGEQRAKTGVVPMTEGVDRYELLTPGVPTRLVLNDTVGYAHSGPKADQVKTTAQMAQQSDLLFLVLHARNPGRQADLDMLQQLEQWFNAHSELKSPPIVAVLTHIDLLSPAMEWAPPYQWIVGDRPKERNIRDAVATVREQFGPRLVGVVPVCTAPGKEFGIDEALLPFIAQWLDEVRGVALLRVLKSETDRDKIRRVFSQLYTTGKLLVDQVRNAIGA